MREVIQDATFDGVPCPGQKIIKQEVSESTGVSRTTGREALACLEEQWLAGRETTNGSIVAKISADGVEEIYEVRTELEALAAKRFTQRANPIHLEGIAVSIALVEQAFDMGKNVTFRGARTNFYNTLIQGSSRLEIKRSLTAMGDRIYLLRSQSKADAARGPESFCEMQALLTALPTRDAQAAQDATYLHVAAAARSAARQLELLNLQGVRPE